MAAAQECHNPIVELLLNNGAAIDAANKVSYGIECCCQRY
jgi:hypothetical protein